MPKNMRDRSLVRCLQNLNRLRAGGRGGTTILPPAGILRSGWGDHQEVPSARILLKTPAKDTSDDSKMKKFLLKKWSYLRLKICTLPVWRSQITYVNRQTPRSLPKGCQTPSKLSFFFQKFFFLTSVWRFNILQQRPF